MHGENDMIYSVCDVFFVRKNIEDGIANLSSLSSWSTQFFSW